jgi:hypothetical protein
VSKGGLPRFVQLGTVVFPCRMEETPCRVAACLVSEPQFFNCVFLVSGILVFVGIVFEPPDQRLKFSLFHVVLSWWFLKHTRNVFDEMCKTLSRSIGSVLFIVVSLESCLHLGALPF